MKTSTLKSFLAFCILHFAFSNNSIAQIIYTDVNPDLVSTGTYNLDLNHDGTTDFVIMHSSSAANTNLCGVHTNNYVRVTPSGTNQVLDYSATDATKMAINSTIDASVLTWNNSANQLLVSQTWACKYVAGNPFKPAYWTPYSSTSGTWYNAVDGCLGLKLVSGSNTFYGWLRMNTSGAASFTIKDFAYNSIPDQGILAGQSTADYIAVSTVSSPLCAGGNVNVPYTIIGTFNLSNIVTAELSDALGSFASPVSIGSIVSNVSGSINATIPALTLAGTAYRIRVTTSSPAQTSYAEAGNLAVNAGLPSGTITTSGSTNVCEGNVSLSTVTGANYSYQWMLNGNTIANAISSYYTATTAGDYTCVKTNGCGSVTSNTIAITSVPVAALITTSGSTTTCGTSVYLSTTRGTGNTYQWKLNGNVIVNATSSAYNAPATGDYTCVKTSACGSVTSNILHVTVNPLPATVSITASPATVVCTAPVSLTSNAGSGLTFEWHNSSGIISGASLSSYDAGVSGSYYLRVTNGYNCSGNSNSISLLIGSPLATVSPVSGSICKGNPVLLYGSPAGASYSYQWIKNGVDIPGASGQTYSAGHAGTYSARVTIISGGCNNTSGGAVVSHGCRLSSDNSSSVDFPVFSLVPNPISTSAKISFMLDQQEKITLKIFDVSGRLVSTLADKIFEAGENELMWSTAELNAGIYFLQFQSAENLKTEKLIVTK